MIIIPINLRQLYNAVALCFKARHIDTALLGFTVLFSGGIVLTTSWCPI